MAVIMSGKEAAETKKTDIRRRVKQLKSIGIFPALKIVMVGDREDASAYAGAAGKALSQCGIDCDVGDYPDTISQDRLIREIQEINGDDGIHGLLIMRPLPEDIDWTAVEAAVSPDKDVDCITSHNLGKVFQGSREVFHPCTAQAVIDILKHYRVELKGRNVAVIGRSLVVGRPVAMMLLREDATVTLCHSKTEDLSGITSRADIIVAAVGVPRLVKREHVKEGCIVVDVGINVVDGKLVGDVDFEEAAGVASMITPVPGGIGSVTNAVLMEHIVAAAEKRQKK